MLVSQKSHWSRCLVFWGLNLAVPRKPVCHEAYKQAACHVLRGCINQLLYACSEEMLLQNVLTWYSLGFRNKTLWSFSDCLSHDSNWLLRGFIFYFRQIRFSNWPLSELIYLLQPICLGPVGEAWLSHCWQKLFSFIFKTVILLLNHCNVQCKMPTIALPVMALCFPALFPHTHDLRHLFIF